MTFENVKHSSITHFSNPPLSTAKLRYNPHSAIAEHLISLLENLATVEQAARFHPEGDALFHTLQVFEIAMRASNAPTLWAAALLHDVGKAIDYPNHALAGADALEGIIHPDICWLIRHHLDLLIHPKRTRARLKGTKELRDLEQLRTWDLQGRDPYAQTISPAEAVRRLIPYFDKIICPSLVSAK